MGWGVMRLVIFGAAFGAGAVLGGIWDTVFAPPSFSTEELSSRHGAMLVVACTDGNPMVERVTDDSGALQVKCEKSRMRVVRLGPPKGPSHSSAPVSSPSGPFAVFVP